jgi:hypothetical protein
MWTIRSRRRQRPVLSGRDVVSILLAINEDFGLFQSLIQALRVRFTSDSGPLSYTRSDAAHIYAPPIFARESRSHCWAHCRGNDCGSDRRHRAELGRKGP